MKIFTGGLHLSRFAALALAGLAGAASANVHNGALRINGGLTEGACQLEMDSAWQHITLGAISSAELSKPGARSAPVNFQIRFRDCVRGKGMQQDEDYGTQLWSESQPVVNIVFVAPADANTPDLLAVRGAAGVGLRITDKQSRTIKPGRKGHPVFLTPGNDELTFNVAVERTAAPLVVGAYSATADFRVSYE